MKVMVKFKGRQMAHQDIGAALLERFADALSECGDIDKKPVLEGRNLTMFFAPSKK